MSKFKPPGKPPSQRGMKRPPPGGRLMPCPGCRETIWVADETLATKRANPRIKILCEACGQKARDGSIAEGILDVALPAAGGAREVLSEGMETEKTYILAVSAQAYVDALLVDCDAKAPARPACARGCSFCCYIPVNALAPEILTIADRVRRYWSDDDRAVLLDRIEANIAATEGMDFARRKLVRVRCPLLNDAGECSVYDIRPMACRSWHSFDAELCRKDFERPETQPLQINNERIAVRHVAEVGVRVALDHAGVDHRNFELVRGLKIALDEPAAAERWRSGEPVFNGADAGKILADAPVDERTEGFQKVLWRSIEESPGWKL